MTFGTSIFLLAAGAILAFAVRDAVDGVALDTVGYILMGAGALGILLSLMPAPPWVVRDDAPRDRRLWR